MRRGRRDVLCVKMFAICLRPCPAANISKMRRTTGAVMGSGSRRWSLCPRTRFLALGCSPASEQVAVGWAAAKMAVARLRQHRHTLSNTDPDQVAFLLGRAAEHPQQHLGRGRAEVDSASDLREPQLDPPVRRGRGPGPVLFEQLMAAQRDERVLRDGAFWLVLRTRLAGEPLTEVAQREKLPRSVLAQRRWRAECRRRQLRPAASSGATEPASDQADSACPRDRAELFPPPTTRPGGHYAEHNPEVTLQWRTALWRPGARP
jgi:hypothetical protein